MTFGYDAGAGQLGRLTSMSDASGSASFTYDAFGNLTEETRHTGGQAYTTRYDYDADDTLTAIVYPSGRRVDYTRNSLGQVTTVATTFDGSTQTVASGIGYAPFGPLTGLTFGNGLAHTRDHDLGYRLEAISTGGAQDQDFTLDAASNITAITDGVTPANSQSFGYDAVNRLIDEAGAYGSKDYSYDANGNRLSRIYNDGTLTITQTLTYVADSNRLATLDGQSITLDAAGNTLSDPTANTSFDYGDHDRMLKAYVDGVLVATYSYNGQGQRVKKVEATGSQRTFVFHYGPGGVLLGETIHDSQGAKITVRE